jgi:hypothetical protein
MPKRHLVSFTNDGKECPPPDSKDFDKFPECDLKIRNLRDKPFEPLRKYRPTPPFKPIPPRPPPIPPIPPPPEPPPATYPSRKDLRPPEIAPIRRNQIEKILVDMYETKRRGRVRDFQQLEGEDPDIPPPRPRRDLFKPDRGTDVDELMRKASDEGGVELVDIKPYQDKAITDDVDQFLKDFDIAFGKPPAGSSSAPNPNELRVLNDFEDTFRKSQKIIDDIFSNVSNTGNLTTEDLVALRTALAERTNVSNAYETGKYGTFEDATLDQLVKQFQHENLFGEADIMLDTVGIKPDNPNYQRIKNTMEETAIRSNPDSYTEAQKREVLGGASADLSLLEPDVVQPKAPLKPKSYTPNLKPVDIRNKAFRETLRYKNNEVYINLKNKFGKLPAGVKNVLLPQEYKEITDSIILQYRETKGIDPKKTLQQRDIDNVRKIVEDLVIDIQNLDHADLTGEDFVAFRENIESKIHNNNNTTRYN